MSEQDSGARIVFVAAGSEEEAVRIGRVLVEERLAACANIVPRVRSIYRWAGAIEDEAESFMLIKTRRERIEALKARIAALHSYDVPEIVVVRIEDGLGPYLDWIAESTSV